MTTHDPKKQLEDLRDHLARHDRPLSFLFGAGTSSSVNVAPAPAPGQKATHEPLIPAVAKLTEICERSTREKGDEYGKAWDAVVRECEATVTKPNIEDILSKTRQKIDAIGPDDVLLGLNAGKLMAFEKTICETIAEVASPDPNSIPEKLPHDAFASWLKHATRTNAVEIFTMNYDLLLEIALEGSRIPIFDGFIGAHQPLFVPECLERKELLPSKSWVRLWKIHGSINWQRAKRRGSQQIIRTQPVSTGEMILPSHRKYDESRKQPYVSLLNRLGKILDQEDSLLITCGFSFSDEHINSVILTSLEGSLRSHVISLQFGELSEASPIVKYALQRKNLLVLARNGAVIRSEWAFWKLLQPVDNASSAFMDVAFDSKAAVDSADDGLEGGMRLGDFNRFCRFLLTMTPQP